MNVVVKNNWMVLPKKLAVGENYTVLAKAMVDGAQWYTVRCTKEASQWVRATFSEQENKLWFDNIDHQWQLNKNVYDMHEKLYTMLIMRWS